ncbi:hypothetical protein [Streptomyces sp. NPDC058548]|uniref:hypothetical protein n=1 Tax=unclassified Streptomyces TaxID=2593676 RepID=UPI00365485F3
MITTINDFLDRRAIPGRGFSLLVLREIITGWSRKTGGSYVEIGVLEEVLIERGYRIGSRPNGEPVVIGLGILGLNAPDNPRPTIAPNSATAAAAMRRIYAATAGTNARHR